MTSEYLQMLREAARLAEAGKAIADQMTVTESQLTLAREEGRQQARVEAGEEPRRLASGLVKLGVTEIDAYEGAAVDAALAAIQRLQSVVRILEGDKDSMSRTYGDALGERSQLYILRKRYANLLEVARDWAELVVENNGVETILANYERKLLTIVNNLAAEEDTISDHPDILSEHDVLIYERGRQAGLTEAEAKFRDRSSWSKFMASLYDRSVTTDPKAGPILVNEVAADYLKYWRTGERPSQDTD